MGVSKKQLRHERCKGEVVKRVNKLEKAVGLIDEDPDSTQPRDLSNYREIQNVQGLRLLIRRDDNNKRLIVICPRLEDWLLQRAKLLGIKPEDFGLPSQADRLHSIVRYDKKAGYIRFLKELKRQDKGMQLLAQWIH